MNETQTNDQVKISIPLVDIKGGYCSRHINVGRLSARQSGALRMVRDGLHFAGEKLAVDGEDRTIGTNADSIRWLLDKIADQMEPEALVSYRYEALCQRVTKCAGIDEVCLSDKVTNDDDAARAILADVLGEPAPLEVIDSFAKWVAVNRQAANHVDVTLLQSDVNKWISENTLQLSK